MKKTILMAVIFLVGCGGDNKNNDSNNPPELKSYSLEKLTSLTPGVVYASEMKEAESGYYSLFEIENLSEKVESGVLVTQQRRFYDKSAVRFGSSRIGAPQWESIFNIETATKNLVSFQLFVSSSGMGPRINCVSSSPYHFPAQVKVGDSDRLPSYACDNNINLGPGAWSTADAGNGNLNFVVRTQTIDLSSQVIDEVITYTINQQGDIIATQINGLKSFKD
jgi:hypothetical protein